MKNFISVSPLRILEKSSRRSLGAGNLGVLIARAGVGKTACLIHIAFDKLYHQEKLVHVSVEEGPEKVMSYYNVIFYELLKALDISDENESRILIEKNRMILSYLHGSFEPARLRKNLQNLAEKLDFKPNAIIFDGLDFENTGKELFLAMKKIAEDFQIEIWFSALSHRHISEVNERGVPYPCDKLDDLFSLILQLQPDVSGVYLKLLKDHDNPSIPDVSVRLDPNTFLALDRFSQ